MEKQRFCWHRAALAGLVATLVLALALPAAAGMGRGRMMMANLTPEQAAQVFDLRQKFMNDTAALRREMFIKRAELLALWKAETPDEKAIVAKAKELHGVKGQLMEKAVAMRLALKKIAPQAMMGFGGGFGPGMGPGMGRGMGPGMGGPGPGPGPRSEMDPDGLLDGALAFEPDLE
jgi:zinc resistance-associated protein